MDSYSWLIRGLKTPPSVTVVPLKSKRSVRESVQEMHRQVGPLKFGPNGLARRGVLVRHLVMPEQLEEATAIFRWLSEHVSFDTYVNIMGQYRPEYQVGEIAHDGNRKYDEIDRRPEQAELHRARQTAREARLWRFDERWLA